MTSDGFDDRPVQFDLFAQCHNHNADYREKLKASLGRLFFPVQFQRLVKFKPEHTEGVLAAWDNLTPY